MAVAFLCQLSQLPASLFTPPSSTAKPPPPTQEERGAKKSPPETGLEEGPAVLGHQKRGRGCWISAENKVV